MTRVLAGGLLIALIIAFAAPARAEKLYYELYVSNLNVARAVVDVSVRRGKYEVVADVETAGLASWFYSIDLHAHSTGLLHPGGRVQPFEFKLDSVSTNYERHAHVIYHNGVPQILHDSVKRMKPPKYPPGDPAPPGDQGGTLDALSAMVLLALPMMPDMACGQSVDIYDGRRVTRIETYPPMKDDGLGGFTCEGRYQRIAGYSQEELAKQQDFPFTVFLDALPDGRVQIAEVVGEVFIGTGILRRVNGAPD